MPADLDAGLAWLGRPWGSSGPGQPAAHRGRAGWAGEGEQSWSLRLGKCSARCARCFFVLRTLPTPAAPRREGSGVGWMCSRGTGRPSSPAPGMPCEARPGRKRWRTSPAHLDGRPEPGRRCCAPLPLGFGLCVSAPLLAAPPGLGAAGAPPLPRSDARWRRLELQRPRRGPGSSLIPALRLCPAASRALGKPCPAEPCCPQAQPSTAASLASAAKMPHGGVRVSWERELLMGQ